MGGLRKLSEKSNYGVGMIGLIVVSERKGEYGSCGRKVVAKPHI